MFQSANSNPIFPLTLSFHYAKVARVMDSSDFLLRNQNRDGGWGYKRGGMSFVEPTAAALLAMSDVHDATGACARGREYLRALQHQDGGWGIAALDEESGWMTGWAAWALAREDNPAASRGADWLLRTEAIRVTDPKTVEQVRRLFDIDAKLTGWPWQVGDASWVFPTALSLLALKATSNSLHPRVEEGIRYLLDRAIPSGGWNIGNPMMLTGEPPATVVNTSLTLISLGGFGISGEVILAANTWLRQRLREPLTAPEIAWGAWAMRTAEFDFAPATTRLQSLLQADGSLDGNPFTTAIGLLAIGRPSLFSG
jgi:hypothetical protein